MPIFPGPSCILVANPVLLVMSYQYYQPEPELLKTKGLDDSRIPERAVRYHNTPLSVTAIQDTSDLIRFTNDVVKQKVTSSWSPNQHQVLIMCTLSLISFMVALDSCTIVTSLNVSPACLASHPPH